MKEKEENEKSYYASCDQCKGQFFALEVTADNTNIVCPTCNVSKIRIADVGIKQLAEKMRENKLNNKKATSKN